jgi:hypothetical protein
MGSDGDFEYGRPRYQPAPGPGAGEPRRLGDGPGGPGRAGEEVGRTAPGAVAVIEAAGGALDGASLAVWAKRLGWSSVVIWSAYLFIALGGYLFGLSKAFLPR